MIYYPGSLLSNCCVYFCVVYNEASLFINNKLGRLEIQRLPSKQEARILGVCMARNSQSITQKENLGNTTEEWADIVRSGHIRMDKA